MEIQKINNSPSFQAIKISPEEYRTVNDIFQKYKNKPNTELKTQLIDIFTPHFKQECEFHDGILRQDFLQEMYLCLLDNLEKIKAKKNPAEKIVNKLNEIKLTKDFYATTGHTKSIEALTEEELKNLTYQIDPTLKYDAKQVVKRTCLDEGRKTILIEKIDNKTDKEIAQKLHVTEPTVKKWTSQTLDFLETDRAARQRAGLYIY